MKKNTLLLVVVVLGLNSLKAQVLYTENFDNFTLGNVSDTANGSTAGQGGWFALGGTVGVPSTIRHQYFQIENETNKGKVLTITTGPVGSHGGNQMFKKGFDVLWNQRTQGNNVLKFEIEMFVPNHVGNPSNPWAFGGDIMLYTIKPKPLASFGYNHFDGMLRGQSSNGLQSAFAFHLAANNGILYLTKNQWYQLIYYVDYDNKKAYVEIPKLGIVKKVDIFDKLTPPDSMFNYPPTELNLSIGRNQSAINELVSFLKFDNIKVTALKSVPPHLLSADNFLAQKFNLYPNPATNIVNITNSENRLVNQVEIYDVTGKLINTQKFNNEAEIHLNVENLASGSYLLHLQTDQGIAVKKLIKK